LKMEKQINLDKLDRILIEAIDKEQSVELAELQRRYPKFREIPYSTLWYRIDSLAEAGHIRIERARKTITCFSIDAKEPDAMSTKREDPDTAPDTSSDRRRGETEA